MHAAYEQVAAQPQQHTVVDEKWQKSWSLELHSDGSRQGTVIIVLSTPHLDAATALAMGF